MATKGELLPRQPNRYHGNSIVTMVAPLVAMLRHHKIIMMPTIFYRCGRSRCNRYRYTNRSIQFSINRYRYRYRSGTPLDRRYSVRYRSNTLTEMDGGQRCGKKYNVTRGGHRFQTTPKKLSRHTSFPIKTQFFSASGTCLFPMVTVNTGWRNENYRCLNRCRSNNFHPIKLKFLTYMPETIT